MGEAPESLLAPFQKSHSPKLVRCWLFPRDSSPFAQGWGRGSARSSSCLLPRRMLLLAGDLGFRPRSQVRGVPASPGLPCRPGVFLGKEASSVGVQLCQLFLAGVPCWRWVLRVPCDPVLANKTHGKSPRGFWESLHSWTRGRRWRRSPVLLRPLWWKV